MAEQQQQKKPGGTQAAASALGTLAARYAARQALQSIGQQAASALGLTPQAPVLLNSTAPMSVNTSASFLPNLSTSASTGASSTAATSGANALSPGVASAAQVGSYAVPLQVALNIYTGVQAMRARNKRNAFIDAAFNDLASKGFDTSKFSGPSLTETPEYQAMASDILSGNVSNRSLGQLASVARVNDFQNMKASNPLEYERQTSGKTIDPYFVRGLMSNPFSVTGPGQAWGGVPVSNVVGHRRQVPLEYFNKGDSNDQTQTFSVAGGPQFSVANQSLMTGKTAPAPSVSQSPLQSGMLMRPPGEARTALDELINNGRVTDLVGRFKPSQSDPGFALNPQQMGGLLAAFNSRQPLGNFGPTPELNQQQMEALRLFPTAQQRQLEALA